MTSSLIGAIYTAHVTYVLRPAHKLKVEFDEITDLYDGRPWARHSSCKKIDEYPGEREFLLAEIPEGYNDDFSYRAWDMLADYVKQRGYRFAIHTEAIDFAYAHPNVQRETDVIALGSFTISEHQGQGVACLMKADDSPHRLLVGDWIMEDGLSGRLLLVRE